MLAYLTELLCLLDVTELARGVNHSQVAKSSPNINGSGRPNSRGEATLIMTNDHQSTSRSTDDVLNCNNDNFIRYMTSGYQKS